jgi:hypothetical protein
MWYGFEPTRARATAWTTDMYLAIPFLSWLFPPVNSIDERQCPDST